MTVNPGFGGQTFIPRSESKVRAVARLLDRAGSRAPIEVDGGIDVRTAPRIVAAGADILVAGNAVFGSPDPERAIRDLRAAAGHGGRRVDDAPASVSTLRVRYAETDKMGVVYYANYLVWFEVGRADLLRSLGWSYREMEHAGISLPVIEAHCDYLRPARYDDEIEVRTEGRMLSPVRMEFEYQVVKTADQIRRGDRARPCTRRWITTGQAVPAARSACARCSRMKALVTGVAGLHRLAPRGGAARQGRARSSASTASPTTTRARSRSATSRRTGAATGSASSKTTIQDADLAALLDGVTHVFHLAAQAGVRKSWGKRFPDLHRQQRRRDADAARSVRRPAARAVRARLELVGLRRPRRHPDARGCAAAAGVAVRRHEAGGRAARLPLSRELRRAGGRDAVLHGLRPAAAARHGVQPLHPRRARRTSRSRSTATASRRATSRSWPTPSRRRSPPASAACPARAYNIGGGSRVSMNQVFEIIERHRRPSAQDQPRGRAEGGHARHLRRHVPGAGRTSGSLRRSRSKKGSRPSTDGCSSSPALV